MDKLVLALRKPAKLLLLIFVGVYALFELLYVFGRMDAQGGAAIAGGLFFLFAFGGLIAALIIALVKKNVEAARFIGLAFFGFVAMGLIYGLLGGVGGDSALAQAIFAFDFMAALCGIAIFAMMILGLFVAKLKDNKVIALVSLCLLLVYVLFTLLARFMDFGYVAEYNKAYKEYGITYPWYGIVGNLAEIVMLGVVLFGYLLLFVKGGEASEGACLEEAPAESAEEPALEGEVVEEPADEEFVLDAEAESEAEPFDEQ